MTSVGIAVPLEPNVTDTNAELNVQQQQQQHNVLNDFERFKMAKMSKQDIDKLKKRSLKAFYRHQNHQIDQLESARQHLLDCKHGHTQDHNNNPQSLAVTLAITGSFIVNILLFAGKLFAAVTSGSLAVVASTIDSALDLVSGALMYIIHRLIARSAQSKTPEEFPVGKNRYENVGIIILSVLMGAASLQVILESIKALIGSDGGGGSENFELAAVIVIAAVIVSKALLFWWCWWFAGVSDSCTALANDHRNDVMSNSLTLIALVISTRFPAMWWLDPTFAIILSLFIIWSWILTGSHHSALVVGKSADQITIAQLIYFAANFDERILYVDTIRAYHGGARLIVECDVVMAPESSFRDTHDIGEELQRGLESFPDVDRAFVHCDYEFEHSPLREHNRLL